MILILGGTGEARELAGALHGHDIPVTTSLAGRVTNPRLPQGAVRIGGFGGPEKLADWQREHGVRAVVDATHPFAERISASAVRAAELSGVPLLRLERPGFQEQWGDRWTWVDDLEIAALAAPALGTRVLLTTGRQGLATFADVGDVWFLIRCVEPPDPPLPPQHELLLDRGPYTLESELQLIDRHTIDLIVTKDSGGAMTQAKLDAARERGLPVIVVRRPPGAGADTVAELGDALAWALAHAAG